MTANTVNRGAKYESVMTRLGDHHQAVAGDASRVSNLAHTVHGGNISSSVQNLARHSEMLAPVLTPTIVVPPAPNVVNRIAAGVPNLTVYPAASGTHTATLEKTEVVNNLYVVDSKRAALEKAPDDLKSRAKFLTGQS